MPAVLTACTGNPDRHTLAELQRVEPDVADVRVEDGLKQAIRGYSVFLEEAPESSLTPEAMRRLADLKVEKEYGILGDGELRELPAPAASDQVAPADRTERPRAAGVAVLTETDEEFERRAAEAYEVRPMRGDTEAELPGEQSPEV
ncbi:MAG: hypothetical protein JSW21_06580, partial [Gammaproteobacteria bacterium]